MSDAPPQVRIQRVSCSQALNKSGIPGADWCINPYGGCAHACVYCYASFMERFRPHETPWGTFVDIKEDVATVLAKQLRRPKSGTVMLSSVTDAWQPVEKEAGVTRACQAAWPEPWPSPL